MNIKSINDRQFGTIGIQLLFKFASSSNKDSSNENEIKKHDIQINVPKEIFGYEINILRE